MPIQSGDITDQARSELHLEQSELPTRISGNNVSFVYPINRRYSTIHKAQVGATTSPATIYTTPTDRDFYLTSVQLATTKDVVCDNVLAYVSVTVDAKVDNIISLLSNTITLSQDHAEMSFPYPLKIDRGIAMTIVGTFTAGAMIKRAQITGFLI